ncbi:hypothetical protein [Mycolicibacterium mageritense]|uniref:hypothetical protein n=1 Tax=Mycolicibacterium mageritense TaxID=53462 RepID=UPI001E3702A1|nr:hypothetical protein [Mycolicibacterium mageritense]GJJ24123.1 hypothetical protein MTY414_77970 [Mycolicibacterium mageritense]
MRTTEERARADAELVDTGEHPELDRRLIRCACLHSLDAHEPGRPGWPPQGNRACTRCDCSRYATRPAPWRVVFRPLGGGDCSLITLWPWLVLSPRGTIAYAMAERNSALNMARSMSAVESMLTFVDRYNRRQLTPIGNHPAGRGFGSDGSSR